MRIVLLVAGWLAMALGLAGVFLPLLPTTPFLLLAAACFVRSSPRLHAKLMAHPRLGPFLEQWRRERSIPRAAKRRAYVLVVACFALSIALVDPAALKALLAGLGVGLLLFLRSLRTSP
ncbi:MAG TPA: YbaN family protein [Planctomycetota bacterium]